MSAMLLALFLYLLLRVLAPKDHSEHQCQLCYDKVHWNGRQFVHSDGRHMALYQPAMDDLEGRLMEHPALPAEY